MTQHLLEEIVDTFKIKVVNFAIRHLSVFFIIFLFFPLLYFVCTPAITSWLPSKPENLWRAGADTSLNHQIVPVMDDWEMILKLFTFNSNLARCLVRAMCDMD